MRDMENIDAELRLLARAWRAARELCDRMPSIAHIDELLDERTAALSASVETEILRRARMRYVDECADPKPSGVEQLPALAPVREVSASGWDETARKKPGRLLFRYRLQWVHVQSYEK